MTSSRAYSSPIGQYHLWLLREACLGELEDFASPKEAVVVGSIRWAATDYFYVEGKVTNEWWLAPDSASYDTTLNFDFGVGFLLNI